MQDKKTVLPTQTSKCRNGRKDNDFSVTVSRGSALRCYGWNYGRQQANNEARDLNEDNPHDIKCLSQKWARALKRAGSLSKANARALFQGQV
eukprot:CAMPEP_0171654974 /NCGR_PEP_ID=MMETSP0990-20121206/40569_1 /TAXON_ID=483369 /ORGANISM="non described non described, Strain CCMP2098" /LENGTH=91 /DNA_ID=CAMNT_0012234887 /DNA_START=398 /DNA_END=670 /DNA_ORIENTATION=+